MSNFWDMSLINPDMILFETQDYVVVVTPKEWRPLGKEIDRVMSEYSIMNKNHNTLEAQGNVSSTVVQFAKTMQEQWDLQKEVKNAPALKLVRKDDSE